MKKVVVVSAFIAKEGSWKIRKISSKDKALDMLNGQDIDVFTQHETVKVLGITPVKERKTYIPDDGETQLWIKPKSRLEFGKEYTKEEIEKIGYTIYVASKED